MDSVIKTILVIAILVGLAIFSVLYVPKMTTMYNVKTPAVYYAPSYSNFTPPPNWSLIDYNYDLKILRNNLSLASPVFNALWQNTPIVNCTNPVALWAINMVNNDSLNNATYIQAINQSIGNNTYQYTITNGETVSLNVSSKYCYVKLGLIKLPYGLGLIILEYGNYYGGYDIDIIETVVNTTQFMQLLEYTGISAINVYAPPQFLNNGVNNFTGYVMYPLWHKVIIGWGFNGPFYVETVSYMLDTQNDSNEPLTAELEALEWDLNEPAFALAYYLAYGNSSQIDYTQPISLTENFFSNANGETYYTGRIGNEPYTTIIDFVLNHGGVCGDFTDAYSMFATNYLGAPTADIYYNNSLDHELAVLLLPFNYSKAGFNLTLYGINYSGSVLADTAGLGYNVISNPKYGGQLQVEAPLLYIPAFNYGEYVNPPYNAWLPYVAFTGIPQAILNMPTMFQTPWLIHFKNLTETYLSPSTWDNSSIRQSCSNIQWYLDSMQNITTSLKQHYLLFVPPDYNQTAIGEIKVLMNFSNLTPNYTQIYNAYNSICNFTNTT